MEEDEEVAFIEQLVRSAGEKGGASLDLEIWLCDPNRARPDGHSGAKINGCGFLMLQVPCDMMVTECPGCHESYPFQETGWKATIPVSKGDVKNMIPEEKTDAS
jgi:hypothetical protein